MLSKRVIVLALAAALSPAAAPAAQFHVPLHVPPRLERPVRESGTAFLFGLAWMRASASGLDLDGPGGTWELGVRAGEKTTVHLHSDAFVFRGHNEAASAGRRKTGGLSGTFEGDVSRPLTDGGALRAYIGALASLTMMDVADPLSIQRVGNTFRMEPDLATSFVVGVPIGLVYRTTLGESWSPHGALYAVAYPGGGTLFSYSIGPPGLYGSSRKIDAHAAGGLKLGLEYIPWRLGLEAGGGITTSSGNNDALTTAYALLAWRLF